MDCVRACVRWQSVIGEGSKTAQGCSTSEGVKHSTRNGQINIVTRNGQINIVPVMVS